MAATPISLLEYLASFDRKERYLVVRGALGMMQFTLSPDFREQLTKECGLAVPALALVGFDFHLDWLYAGLKLAAGADESTVQPNDDHVASGNQEDSDLLVGWRDGAMTNLVLVEAKGTTGWSNAQLLSKVHRLEAIFGPEGSRFDGVTPRFVLWSPRRPRQRGAEGGPRLQVEKWPTWMKDARGEARWMRLLIPGSLRRVTRCDAVGRPSATGSFWRILTSAPDKVTSVEGDVE